MKSPIAVDGLNSAVARRGEVTGCIAHADRGSLRRSHEYIRALTRHRIVGLMGRMRAAGNSAAIESFFALVQNNILSRRICATCEEPSIAIVTRFEGAYHRHRNQDAFGTLTPIRFETETTTPATHDGHQSTSPNRAAVPSVPTGHLRVSG